jgi:ketosteroid isomerase-like protein
METGSTRTDIARRLLTCAGQGDIAAVEPLIAADFVLEQMVRDPDAATAPAGTRYDRASYLGFLGAVKAMTKSGMNLSLERVIEAGDDVVVFGTSDAAAPSGWRYRNAYCWHLVFAGHQVSLMREYFDTALAQRLIEG